jgi:hypothetical protein
MRKSLLQKTQKPFTKIDTKNFSKKAMQKRSFIKRMLKSLLPAVKYSYEEKS